MKKIRSSNLMAILILMITMLSACNLGVGGIERKAYSVEGLSKLRVKRSGDYVDKLLPIVQVLVSSISHAIARTDFYTFGAEQLEVEEEWSGIYYALRSFEHEDDTLALLLADLNAPRRTVETQYNYVIERLHSLANSLSFFITHMFPDMELVHDNENNRNERDQLDGLVDSRLGEMTTLLAGHRPTFEEFAAQCYCYGGRADEGDQEVPSFMKRDGSIDGKELVFITALNGKFVTTGNLSPSDARLIKGYSYDLPYWESMNPATVNQDYLFNGDLLVLKGRNTAFFIGFSAVTRGQKLSDGIPLLSDGLITRVVWFGEGEPIVDIQVNGHVIESNYRVTAKNLLSSESVVEFPLPKKYLEIRGEELVFILKDGGPLSINAVFIYKN